LIYTNLNLKKYYMGYPGSLVDKEKLLAQLWDKDERAVRVPRYLLDQFYTPPALYTWIFFYFCVTLHPLKWMADRKYCARHLGRWQSRWNKKKTNF
jgi:hypothetical protein